MAAPGQRIHPADSRSRPPRHARAGRSAGARPLPRARRLRRRLRRARRPARARTRSSQMALEAVARVAHRGAASTDNSGDGAGLLTQIPPRLFYRDAYRLGLHLQPGLPVRRRRLLPPARARRARRRRSRWSRRVLAGDGIPLPRLARRARQPGGARGRRARASCPVIRQVLVGRPAAAPTTRPGSGRCTSHDGRWSDGPKRSTCPGFYVCSLSCRTIVYKALLTGHPAPGLLSPTSAIPEYESAIAVFHQRYSTNTLPSWPLAQPFRLLAHNGEINTLWGNRNAMTMRQPMLASPLWGDARSSGCGRSIWKEGSDSASLDNAMELLVRSGRDAVHTAMMMIPQAWEKYPDVDPAGQGVLRVPPVRAGAVGRARGARLHRRHRSPARRWTGTAFDPAATRCGATAWWSSAPRWGSWTSTRAR